MITWMQRHKRWLVITIWISTIAFVGAGFVGWGSYDYGKSSGNIGVVGNKEIQVADLQSEYNALYTKYQNALGETFNQEMAKQFKLEEAAYNAVIQKFLLINYAEDLGLYITNKEIANYLFQIPAFSKNGKFDKVAYLSVLKQNRTNPTDFEDKIKTDLLINKVQLILNANVTQQGLKNIQMLYGIEDKVSIHIINSDNLQFDKSLKSIKKYWEQNKAKYTSLESYKISINTVKIGEKKKKSKKDALKQYLKLKKGEIEFEETLVVNSRSGKINAKNILKISQSQINTILKPIEDNGNFIIVKLLEKQQPQPLPFEKAQNLVTQDYMLNQKSLQLQFEIQKVISNFTGTNIGFVNQQTSKIDNLTDDETNKLVEHIFASSTTLNSIAMGNKAIVYKILDSKIATNTKNTDKIKAIVNNLKNNEVISNLLKQLQNKYKIITSVRGK